MYNVHWHFPLCNMYYSFVFISQMQLRIFFSSRLLCTSYTGGKSSLDNAQKFNNFLMWQRPTQWSCTYFSCGATCILYLGFSPNKKVSAKLSSVHKVIFVQGKQFSRASFWTLTKKSIMRAVLINESLFMMHSSSKHSTCTHLKESFMNSCFLLTSSQIVCFARP